MPAGREPELAIQRPSACTTTLCSQPGTLLCSQEMHLLTLLALTWAISPAASDTLATCCLTPPPKYLPPSLPPRGEEKGPAFMGHPLNAKHATSVYACQYHFRSLWKTVLHHGNKDEKTEAPCGYGVCPRSPAYTRWDLNLTFLQRLCVCTNRLSLLARACYVLGTPPDFTLVIS